MNAQVAVNGTYPNFEVLSNLKRPKQKKISIAETMTNLKGAAYSFQVKKILHVIKIEHTLVISVPQLHFFTSLYIQFSL